MFHLLDLSSQSHKLFLDIVGGLHPRIVFLHLIVLFFGKGHETSESQAIGIVEVVVDFVRNVLLEVFVGYLFVCSDHVGKQVLCLMTICSQFLDVCIDCCIERVDVIVQSDDQVVSISDEEPQRRWKSLGLHEVDLDESH